MFTLNAPAKINWFLHVLRKRDDGYHEIYSLIQAVSIYDSLTFEEADSIEIATESQIPLKENLVYKAALMLKGAADVKKGARITLRKEIPISAGLGGGSSDAACALVGLNRLWGLRMKTEELCSLGSALGSDIPFFLKGPSSIVKGRGERVMPVKFKRSFPLMLVKPPIGISAKWAYSKVRAGKKPSKELTKKTDNIDNIKIFIDNLKAGAVPDFGDALINDLEPAAIAHYPAVGEIKAALLKTGARAALMSGSGPAVFGVFCGAEEAKKASKSFGPVFWCRMAETLI
jgi:4-diphosphocytidyl-2-C-methyl-D-erythritol kinase